MSDQQAGSNALRAFLSAANISFLVIVNPKKWEGPMLRRIVARIAIAIGVVAAPMVAAAVPAHAWAWSSQVTLTGTAKVIYHPGITGVYVTGSDGEHGWASLGSGNGYSRAYSFKFYNVPGGSGITVNWTVYTNNGSFSNHFGVARPATGANAVRDLCDFGPGC